ncbi:thiazolylpeptide-type bacteriocin [Kitasatospora purpeofusca]|uniref:thiazolylpeptide-type bacteriocin n=1 Tax=Kitasatospora purpeofusca TaxID=67352 RepID=UPI000B147BAA|nr:thiazolylpeptide-type bacteriocin [Kitasatospora purpeofusca]MCX4690236.1 thiazolylpeptide-type bacteriocin [Kitasatospora purpeofusca]
MSDTSNDFGLDLQDLDLSELTVTALRDTVALPENGASHGSCSCQASSSCVQSNLTATELI